MEINTLGTLHVPGRSEADIEASRADHNIEFRRLRLSVWQFLRDYTLPVELDDRLEMYVDVLCLQGFEISCSRSVSA